MIEQNAQVKIVLSQYWLRGSLHLANRRIQDELNDPGTEYVEVSDVQVRSHTSQECLARLAKLTIHKSKIEFVAGLSTTHEASDKRRNCLSLKTGCDAFAIVNENCIEGKLHLSSRSDNCRQILIGQLGRFFPLTEASLRRGSRNKFRIGAPVLFINKDLVSDFHVATCTNTNCLPWAVENNTAAPAAGEKSPGQTAMPEITAHPDCVALPT